MSIDSQLLGADGKVIYTDNQQLHEYLNSDQVEQLRTRPFAIAGRLAAVPGKYQLRMDVTNLVTKQSFSQTRGILVPGLDRTLGDESSRFCLHGDAPTRLRADAAVQFFWRQNPHRGLG